MEALEHLREVPLFEGLSDAEISEIAQAAQEREFPAGAMIVTQGSPSLGFFLLVEGKVQVVRNHKPVAEFGPHGFFGEMSLLEELPRSASVVALEPAKCLVIGSWDFRTLLTKQPEIAIKMLRDMSRRLRETQEQVLD
jgi:CRP/FNR family transcriptional regulator, cyclic AMP receptor protein